MSNGVFQMLYFETRTNNFIMLREWGTIYIINKESINEYAGTEIWDRIT